MKNIGIPKIIEDIEDYRECKHKILYDLYQKELDEFEDNIKKMLARIKQ